MLGVGQKDTEGLNLCQYFSLVRCCAVDNPCMHRCPRGRQRHSALVLLRHALAHLHPSRGLQALRKQVGEKKKHRLCAWVKFLVRSIIYSYIISRFG